MESFYIVNNQEILYEHNWKRRSHRSIAEEWLTQQNANPIQLISESLVFHIKDIKYALLLIASGELDASYGLDFLLLVKEIFKQYFNDPADHPDIITELLSELSDSGVPMTFEIDGLRDLVLPPTILNKLMNAAGMSKYESQGQLSSIPWRRARAKHVTNEIFIDVIEDVKVVVDKRGVKGMTNGAIICHSKLSGNPEVEVTVSGGQLKSPRLHRCIDYDKFQRGEIMFTPPDRTLQLMSYGLEPPLSLPISLDFQLKEDSLEVSISARSVYELVTVEIPVSCAPRMTTTQGESLLSRSEQLSTVVWTIKGMKGRASMTLTQIGEMQASHARLKTSSLTSVVKIDGLKVHRAGEWKPYKGVKYLTTFDIIYRIS